MKSSLKKAVWIIILMVGFTKAWSQQEPQYSQYMFNMMSVNPAYTGTTEALNALWLSRTQWVGLNGAPVSHTFALHTPIRNKRIGIGASVVIDKIGPVQVLFTNLNYAHRFDLNEKLTISLGLKAGFYEYRVNLTDLQLIEADNAFSENFEKKWQPNFGLGVYLYSDNYYAGISIPKLLQTDLEESVSSDAIASELKRHYFITAGYIFELDEAWKIKPSFLNKMVEGAPPSLDLTVQALYNDKFWLGTTYRVGDALIFLFDIQINRQLMVGYSYDITLSGMSNLTNGSHEILISYDFAGFTRDKVKSPRYF